ncbi:MAG: hypothetical protein AVDCRST_MAG58-302, partial [uncultured Rubrobacteraceae bacterium]
VSRNSSPVGPGRGSSRGGRVHPRHRRRGRPFGCKPAGRQRGRERRKTAERKEL